MSAMRLFSRPELEEAMTSLGCIKDGSEAVGGLSCWKTANGKTFTIPAPDAISEKYSDQIYHDIVRYADSES